MERENLMSDQYKELHDLNIKIGTAEDKADRSFFDSLLATAFAFRRRTGQVVDREVYLNDLPQGASRGRVTNIEAIMLTSDNRAVVMCLVTFNDTGEVFHNLRLFVRERPDNPWQLLAWANEEIKIPKGSGQTTAAAGTAGTISTGDRP
jgi:hypothetical protein